MKKTVFIIAFLILASLNIILFLTNLANDISIEPINPILNLDYKRSDFVPRPQRTLISFGAGQEVFFQNQNFQVLSALNKGFDSFILYRRSLIDEIFYKENKAILDENTGAGFWLWKPYFILKTMSQMPENAIIVYVDVGASFSGDPSALFESLEKHSIVFYGYNEKRVGKQGPKIPKKVLDYMGISPEKVVEIPSLWAGFIAVRNCKESRDFMSNWLKVCQDGPLLKGELSEGGYHQHDQTLLALTYIKFDGNFEVMDESQAGKFLVWHHRKQGRKELSLQVEARKYFTSFEKKILRFFNKLGILHLIRSNMKTRLEIGQDHFRP